MELLKFCQRCSEITVNTFVRPSTEVVLSAQVSYWSARSFLLLVSVMTLVPQTRLLALGLFAFDTLLTYHTSVSLMKLRNINHIEQQIINLLTMEGAAS